MNTISKTYALYYYIEGFEHYKLTKDGKLFNILTGRELKKVYQSRSIGHYIDGRFRSLKWIKTRIERIKIIDCPF